VGFHFCDTRRSGIFEMTGRKGFSSLWSIVSSLVAFANDKSFCSTSCILYVASSCNMPVFASPSDRPVVPGWTASLSIIYTERFLIFSLVFLLYATFSIFFSILHCFFYIIIYIQPWFFLFFFWPSSLDLRRCKAEK
jgi:hypothetical protein